MTANSQDGRIRHEDLQGTAAMQWDKEQQGRGESEKLAKERLERTLAYGLPAAESIRDRTMSLFVRGRWRINSGTFQNVDFVKDMRTLGENGEDVAIIGAPYDGGTTNRPGTRFGPQAIRRMSSLTSGYNPDMNVELHESLNIVDVGDINVLPSNLEKTFDQVAKAVSFVAERELFPIVLGGDHALGYPDVRGLAPFIDGNIGIIHFDRHSDLSEYSLDERMHGSPFFHATNIPNAPPQNLVQIGIGGWTSSREGLRVARERQATVMTMADVDRYGADRVIEYALEIAWKNAKAVWISFDVDSLDPAFTPGTGTPMSGGLTPRETFRMMRGIAKEGLVGMEVVEVAPAYDVADNTALVAVHSILDVLGAMVANGKLGRTPKHEAAPEAVSTDALSE
jgi:agmatinase